MDNTADSAVNGRRHLFGLSLAAAGAAGLLAVPHARAATVAGAASPTALMQRIAQMPARRDFKTVPMILDKPGQWDAEALDAVMAYGGHRKQVWDNTDIASPWLNVMRNSLNTQQFSFHHADFLAVSATHGTAHLALFDDHIWDKYKLGALTGGKFKSNTLLPARHVSTSPQDFEEESSVFGPAGNTISALQSRGIIFLACHNAIWEVTGKLIAKGINPDHKPHPEVAADLTNHLVPGAVLTPGIVATIPELQSSGFVYIK